MLRVVLPALPEVLLPPEVLLVLLPPVVEVEFEPEPAPPVVELLLLPLRLATAVLPAVPVLGPVTLDAVPVPVVVTTTAEPPATVAVPLATVDVTEAVETTPLPVAAERAPVDHCKLDHGVAGDTGLTCAEGRPGAGD